jgi:ATP-dependent DNA helicase UvrD/PcrA
LIPNDKSNLGWRILIELFLDEQTQRQIINASLSGKPLLDLVPTDFIKRQMRAIELARSVRSKESTFEDIGKEMKKVMGNEFASEISNFLQKADAPVPEIDRKLPTISLTSFKGCKGLSAGHVLIVGVHNGCMPKDNNHISDVEISQFVVALTRTRKQCHILSNDWWAGPRNSKGWIARFETSLFLSWIPNELKEDRGNLRAKDLK